MSLKTGSVYCTEKHENGRGIATTDNVDDLPASNWLKALRRSEEG